MFYSDTLLRTFPAYVWAECTGAQCTLVPITESGQAVYGRAEVRLIDRRTVYISTGKSGLKVKKVIKFSFDTRVFVY